METAKVQRIAREFSYGEIASVQRIAKDSTAYKRDSVWRSGLSVITTE